ncbi:MAG: hypothetical protein Q4D31_06345 [Eubacteriales bacterium]|nr:hypothetical protein [Eubacteriales bacterium]
MLQSLPFEGTIRVRNKGVDIALLADADTVDAAFAASRELVVCGVSTAVLEVTCLSPIDTRTLESYEQITPRMLALTRAVYDAVRPCLHSAQLSLYEGAPDRAALVAAVRQRLRPDSRI